MFISKTLLTFITTETNTSDMVLGDGHEAVEGTLGVHILAVVLVRVQVSVQLVQCP